MSSTLDPLVSIITPTYNHEYFIGNCIQSVLDQTFNNWEQIIIDDGSSDTTLKIAKEFAQHDHRITVLTQKNVGIFRLSETYNRALKLAKGKYIAILEGDDIWKESKLSKQVAALEKDDEAVLCWSRASCMASRTGEVLSVEPKDDSEQVQYYNNDPVGSILNVQFFKNCIPALTILIRKSTLESIGGFLQVYNLPLVDYPTHLELATLGKFHFINEDLGSWRIYSTQVTKTYTVNITNGVQEVRKNILGRIAHIPKGVFSLDMRQYEKTYKSRMVIDYSRSGRYALIRKEYKKARSLYKSSIMIFPFTEPLWKVRSIIGYLFSLIQLDVEFLSDIVGQGKVDK